MYGRGYPRGGGVGFGPPVTPQIIKQLLIAHAVAFALQFLIVRAPGGMPFSVVPAAVWQGGYLWQPFTYMWLHGGLFHIGMNMFVLWMFGSQVAMAWGTRRFLRYYLTCGIGAGWLIATYPYLLSAVGVPSADLFIPTLGASGAVYGVMLAYSLIWPDRTIMLIFPPVAFRAIWLIPILFFFELYSGQSNVSHVGHLGGVLVGWLYLRRSSEAAGLPRLSLERLKYRWRRYRMRQRLRAVQNEESSQRQRSRRDDDHTVH